MARSSAFAAVSSSELSAMLRSSMLRSLSAASYERPDRLQEPEHLLGGLLQPEVPLHLA